MRFRILGWTVLALLTATVGVLIAELSLPAYVTPSSVVRRLVLPYKPQAVSRQPSFGQGPVFRYSVIPGGVQTGEQLQAAMDADPVVAAHHARVTPAAMRAEHLPADRLVYMSYRKSDRVYWTKQPVLLRRGEAVLSDGEHDIRARCGNAMSFDPMLPTEEDQPDPAEFEQLVGAPTVLTSRPFVNLPTTLLIGDTPDAGGPPVPFVGMYVPTGIAGDPNRPWLQLMPDPVAGDSSDDFFLLDPEVDPEDKFVIEDILDPGDIVPGIIDGDPSAPGLPGLPDDPDDLFPGGDPGTPLVPGDPFDDPVPAPEPATLLLLGGGISALLARRHLPRAK